MSQAEIRARISGLRELAADPAYHVALKYRWLGMVDVLTRLLEDAR